MSIRSRFTKQEAQRQIRFLEDCLDKFPPAVKLMFKTQIQEHFDFLEECKRQAPNSFDDENQPI